MRTSGSPGFLFGINDILAITGLPEGATVRVKQVEDEFAIAFVTYANGDIAKCTLVVNADGTTARLGHKLEQDDAVKASAPEAQTVPVAAPAPQPDSENAA